MKTHALAETEIQYVQVGLTHSTSYHNPILGYETDRLLPLSLGRGLELEQDIHDVLQGLDLLLEGSGHISLVVAKLRVKVLAVWHTGLDGDLSTLADQVAVMGVETTRGLVGSQEGCVELLGGVVDAQAEGRGGELQATIHKSMVLARAHIDKRYCAHR